MGARVDHTATVLSSGQQVLVLVHGGRRGYRTGSTISAPVILHLGKLITMETVLILCNRALAIAL